MFCQSACRDASVEFGFVHIYKAALKSRDAITSCSVGRFEIPVRVWPWTYCDRYALYHRRDELFEKLLSAGISVKTMVVVTASSAALLASAFAIDDIRERRIVTDTAMQRTVSLMHAAGLELLEDGESEVKTKTDEAMLFAVIGKARASSRGATLAARPTR